MTKSQAAMQASARATVRDQVPADGLLHPVALVALAMLVINDHVLKVYAPSPLTGILSGVAGIIILPLVLQAGWETVQSLRGRGAGPSLRVLLVGCLATGIAYAAVEMVPPITELYRYGWGALQWPASAMLALVDQEALPRIVPVLAVADPLDLSALPFLTIPWWLGRQRASRPLENP
jgi:hypothetical protein